MNSRLLARVRFPDSLHPWRNHSLLRTSTRQASQCPYRHRIRKQARDWNHREEAWIHGSFPQGKGLEKHVYYPFIPRLGRGHPSNLAGRRFKIPLPPISSDMYIPPRLLLFRHIGLSLCYGTFHEQFMLLNVFSRRFCTLSTSIITGMPCV